MDNPVAMPNQDPPKAMDSAWNKYTAEMICRACGYEPENVWVYYYEDLPLFCPECREHAVRPKMGLSANRVNKDSA